MRSRTRTCESALIAGRKFSIAPRSASRSAKSASSRQSSACVASDARESRSSAARSCSSCFSSGCVCSFVSVGISSESAISSRLRSISFASTIVVDRLTVRRRGRSRTCACASLTRPPSAAASSRGCAPCRLRPRLRRSCRRPGTAGERRVREDVVGRELAELLRRPRSRGSCRPRSFSASASPCQASAKSAIERDGLLVGLRRLPRACPRRRGRRPGRRDPTCRPCGHA